MKKIKFDNYNLYYKKVDNFKTNYISINFVKKAEKKDITWGDFLCGILNESTNNYKTVRELRQAKVGLYGVKSNFSNGIEGNNQVIKCVLEFIDEKFTEKGMNEMSIKFLLDSLLKPNIKNNGFFDNFNFVYGKKESDIKTYSEDTFRYAVDLMYSYFGDGVYKYLDCGYIEDLNDINPENLFNYYKRLFTDYEVSIFVVGNVDEKLFDLFDGLSSFKGNNDYFIECVDKDEVVISESNKHNQSILVTAFSLNNLNDYERNIVLPVFNTIYGSGVSSKLFKVVREKNSLCYTISSFFSTLNNALYVRAGIDKDNYVKTRDLVLKLFNDMVNGEYIESDIEIAKISIVGQLGKINDSIRSIESYLELMINFNFDGVDKRIEKIKNVSKEDLNKLVKKIKLRVDFVLRGEGK